MIPERQPTQWDFDLADVYHKLEICDPDFFTQTDENAEKALKTCESIVTYFANKNEPIKDVTPEDLSFLGDRIKLFNKDKEDDLKKDKKESLLERIIPKDIESRANAVFNILHPDNPEIANLLSLPPDVKKEIFKSLEDKELGSASISSKGLKNIADTINKFRMHAVLAKAQELTQAAKRFDSMHLICQAQIQMDDIKGALLSIDLVESSKKSATPYLLIRKLIEKRDIEQADKFAKPYYEFEDLSLVDIGILELIINALAEIGDVEGVSERKKYLLPGYEYFGNISSAIALAVNGNNNKALEEVDKLHDTYLLETFCKIAKIKSKQGLKEEAAIFFDKAETIIERFQLEDFIVHLAIIGKFQVESGDLERAKANFNTAKAKINLLNNEDQKDNCLTSMFYEQFQCGLLKDAKETAILINPKLDRYSQNLSEVATLQAERGDLEEAEKTINLIQKNTHIYRDRPLVALIKKLAARKQIAEAINILEQIERPHEKIKALIEIYKAQLIAKDAEGAEISFAKALGLLSKTESNKNEWKNLTYELAKAQATFSKFAEAEELVKDLGAEYKIWLLLYISKIQAQNNELEYSQQTFDRAIELMQGPFHIVIDLFGSEIAMQLFKEIYE